MRLGTRGVGTAALLLWVSLLLAGCGGLLPKAPERPLYRLSPAMIPPQPQSRIAALLVIATPTASAGLDTKRIALVRSPVAMDYFADGEWIDRPPFLIKEALVEAFQKSGAFAGVSTEGLGLNADYVLNTDIRDFNAIYDSADNPPLVRVSIAAQLVTMPGRNIAAATSVTREVRAANPDLASIVLAFNRASGEAVQDIIAWAAGNRALSGRGK